MADPGEATSPRPMPDLPRAYNAATHFIDRHLAEGRGAKAACRDERGTTTYAALAERVGRAGNALLDLGLDMEQRVMLCLQDTADFPALFWGAVKAGAVAVPVNTLLTAADYAFMLRDSRARVLVASDSLLPKLAPALADQPFLEHVVVSGTLPEGDVAGRTPLALESLLGAASPALAPAATTRDDVAFWLYSSGSTGAPKGAIHLHSHLVATAVLYAENVLGMREDDVVFSAAKLFFAYGLGNAMTFPLHVGATAALLRGRPTPAACMEMLRTHRPTIFCGVPTLFASMLADEANDRAHASDRLRVCTSAGEALPRDIGERWEARFGAPILDGLGSTEMLHIFLSNRPGDIAYGTTGRPVPGFALRLMDDDGVPVPDGDIGELWVSGPSAAAGYWNNREKTLATFHGPWIRTGDRYTRDADGRYTYAGRSDDMLKAGGIWVSPVEVENTLIEHEAVLEAAVVGREDDEGLTKPMAFVVLRQGFEASADLAAALQAFVKRRLAPYKYPRWVEFIDALPKTATGKIRRFQLRERLRGGRGQTNPDPNPGT